MTTLYSGATARDLIPGNPSDLQAAAARVSALAEDLAQAGSDLTAIQCGDWRGVASDAFRHVMGQQPQRYTTASNSFVAASRAIGVFAQVLEGAQGDAASAITIYEEAEAASAAWRQRRHSAHAVVEAVDPGDEGRARASNLLASAQASVEGASRVLFSALAAAEQNAPRRPSLLESFYRYLETSMHRYRGDLVLLLSAKKLWSGATSIWDFEKASIYSQLVADWRAVTPALLGDGTDQVTMLSEAERLLDESFPTFNNSLIGEKAASLLSSEPGLAGRAGAWLSDPNLATPWFRGLGVAGALFSTGVGVVDTAHDWHKGGAKLATDITGTAFSASTAVAFVCPEVGVPLLAISGVAWGGAEIWEHHQWIDQQASHVTDWAWNHSAPGVLWNNRASIGRTLNAGVDVASSAASGAEHTLSHVWSSL